MFVFVTALCICVIIVFRCYFFNFFIFCNAYVYISLEFGVSRLLFVMFTYSDFPVISLLILTFRLLCTLSPMFIINK